MSQPQAHSEPGPDKPFEIGLVMAGAISAGAYTAGVVDFLIEALDEWEAAKAYARAHPNDPKSRACPTHDVKIKVMAGASAGGMTAGLTTGLLGMKFDSVTHQPPPDRPVTPLNNNLYRSWVNTIDIDPLLGERDLDGDSATPVQSVLDSSVLLDIARNAFHFERPDDHMQRPYVADPLHVLLTVTNLRGVPYVPSFENWPKLQQYEMMMHADYMHFILSTKPPDPPGDALWLQPYNFRNSEAWRILEMAALATGAFPVGLAPQLLKRDPAQYQFREWLIPGPYEQNGKVVCQHWRKIPPYWPTIDAAATKATGGGKAFEYDFLCVDGGVMNNEPLDLARRVLTGPGETDAPEGDKATRAVIMVLPFPNSAPFEVEYNGHTNLFRLLGTTFNCLIMQARFKADELVMANDPDVYSRFLIVPRRGFRHDGTLEPFTIACGSLGGFGGFLSRKFREHDYQLGRRNCQWFLLKYFALPSEGEHRNKLFDHWHKEARIKHRIYKAVEGLGKSPEALETAETLPLLPIIPLVGKAAEMVPEPTWPTFSEAEFDALRPKVKKRLNRVAKTLVDQNIEAWFWGPVARGAIKSAWWLQRDSVVDSVMKTIRKDLTMRGIMRG